MAVRRVRDHKDCVQGAQSAKLKVQYNHWEAAGAECDSISRVTPTSRDPFLKNLEMESIAPYLKPGMQVLDVGSGEGTSALAFSRRVGQVIGVDISTRLLKVANRLLAESKRNNVDFRQGSILELDQQFAPGQFDLVISERCLINLPSWQYQSAAIDQVAYVLRPGGRFLVIEGYQEPLRQLNRYRRAVSLPTIQVVPYNVLMSRPRFERYVSKDFEVKAIRGYGMYFFLSRIFHPLFVYPNPPAHDSQLNKVAAQICLNIPVDHLDSCSYVLFYALRKRLRR